MGSLVSPTSINGSALPVFNRPNIVSMRRPSVVPAASQMSFDITVTSPKQTSSIDITGTAPSQTSSILVPAVSAPNLPTSQGTNPTNLRSGFTWLSSPLIPLNQMPSGISHRSTAKTSADAVVVWSVYFLYVVAFTLALVIIWQLIAQSATNSLIAWGIAFIAVAFAVPLSFYDASKHFLRMASPLQVHYVRCILMVPIFAFESWLALRYSEQRHVLEALRALYESFVIASFFNLMCDYFGGRVEAAAVLAARPGNGKAAMLSPLNWPLFNRLEPAWRIDRASRGHFVNKCRVIIAAFVVVQWFVVFVNLIVLYVGEAQHKDYFCEDSSFGFLNCVRPWTSWLLLYWQCAAVYALVIFYHELKTELDHLEAMPKLFVVKLVVFVSFWQGIVLSNLVFFGIIKASEFYSPTEISISIQNFTICIEMAIAAYLHHRYFSHAEFAGERGIKAGVLLYSAGALSPYDALRALNPMPLLKESLIVCYVHFTGSLAFDVPERPQFDHWAAGLLEKVAADDAKKRAAEGGESEGAGAVAPQSASVVAGAGAAAAATAAGGSISIPAPPNQT